MKSVSLNNSNKPKIIQKFVNMSFQEKLACIFIVIAMLFGLLIVFFNPPFVGPDETSHFLNISRISHGKLFTNIENETAGSFVSSEELDFYISYSGKYWATGEEKYGLSDMWELLKRPATTDMVFHKHNSSTINPLAYILPAAVLLVLRILGFSINAFASFIIAKLINLVFYTLVTAWAISKTKALPKTMFLIALMPMSLYQGASLSYDAPMMACIFLLFAYATKLICSEAENKVTAEDIVAIVFATSVIACTKYAYLVLLLILFTIPFKKFSGLKQYLVCIGLVIAAVGLVYLLPSQIISHTASAYQPPLTEAQILQKEYFRSNFWEFPRILANTVKHLRAWYASSFYGMLGRLEFSLPTWAQNTFFAFLVVYSVYEVGKVKGIRWYTRVLSLLGCTICILGTAIAMFVEHTPLDTNAVNTEMISGIQGRYFIPLTLFAVIAFASPLLLKIKHIEKVGTALRIAVVPFSAVHLCVTVVYLVQNFWL